MYRINDNKMFYDIADGIAVVINFVTGIYYGMDDLASAALDALLGGAGEAAVLDAVKAMDGCPDNVDEAFNGFVQKLIAFEVLLGDGTGGECAPFDQKLAQGGFDFKCDEFSEVMDLILADPIHEVEPEQGWPFVKPQQ